MTKLVADKKRPTKEKFVWTKGRKLGCLAWVIAIPLMFAACGAMMGDDEPKTEPKAKVEAKAEPKAKPKPAAVAEKKVVTDWQAEVKKIAASEGTPVEKFDKTLHLIRQTKLSKEEMSKFVQDIFVEYSTGNYLKDITNDEYMLTNIFKSGIVESNIPGDNVPIDKFAFDFYQNMKYTYRGVDAVDSQAVKANEAQMNKSLSEIK